MQRETAMRGLGSTGTAISRPPHRDEQAVLEVLEPDQLVAAKQQHLGRQRLGPGARILMGGVRGYALLMLVVVADRVVQAVNGG